MHASTRADVAGIMKAKRILVCVAMLEATDSP